MSRLFILRGKIRLVKLGSQLVFRNYIDLASHDFCYAQATWFLFRTLRYRKKIEEGGLYKISSVSPVFIPLHCDTGYHFRMRSKYLSARVVSEEQFQNYLTSLQASNHQVKQRNSIRYFPQVCCLNMNPNLSLVYPNVRI